MPTPRNTSCVRRNAPSTVASPSFRSESRTSNQTPLFSTYISAQHWLDALTPPLEAHILKLAETVSVLLGKTPPPITPSEPTTPPQPPRRPVTPSRKKLVLSVVIALVAVSAITAGYYSSTNNTTPTTSPSAAPADNGSRFQRRLHYLPKHLTGGEVHLSEELDSGHNTS